MPRRILSAVAAVCLDPAVQVVALVGLLILYLLGSEPWAGWESTRTGRP